MSVAYYIVLDNDEPGFDSFVNGKAIAHAIEELDTLCEQADLPRLESFMGQSAEDMADMLGEEIDLPEDDAAPLVWHTADAGIAYIEAVIYAIDNMQHGLQASDEVLEDLEEYRRVLEQAKEVDAKWYLALDM
ncbi:hypothetical protein ACO0K9_05870 [Undibacterium sp. Ji50W]|uniref:hypothetical protein n=1 Tax=Undibacterium sp. Ji50W TaxID=3413041 RepID=UPI003BF08C6E